MCLLGGFAQLGLCEDPASAPRWPGRQPDGSVLLPNMWSLKPAGTQVDLADFPVNMAVHPDGKFAAILHAGNSAHEIHIVDIAKASVVQRVKVEETFYGLEFARSGKRLYASGAGSEVIRFFDFQASTGTLASEQRIVLRDAKERGIPAGLALSSDAQSLYVANVLGQKVAKVTLSGESNPVLDITCGLGNDAQIRGAFCLRPRPGAKRGRGGDYQACRGGP
jgi:DNA-binding beta-propeller fold protein YncE